MGTFANNFLIPGPFYRTILSNGGNPGATNLNASGLGLGWSLFAERPDEITHVGIVFRSKVGVPTALTLTIETLDSDGLPSGTDVGGGSPTAKTFTPPNDATWNNTVQWIQLTNPWTPTRGQEMAVTVKVAGSPDGSNYSSVAYRFDEQWSAATLRNFPLVLSLSAGSWTKTSAGYLCGFRTSTGRHWGCLQATTVNNILASSVGNRVAMAFTIPMSFCSTYSLNGFHIAGRPATADGTTIKFGLWDESGAAISTRTFATNKTKKLYVSGRPFYCIFTDATLPVLNAGTKYYVGLENVDSAPQLDVVPVQDSYVAASFPNGANSIPSSWNGSAWSDWSGYMANVSLIVEEWDAGGGSPRPYHPLLSPPVIG